MIATILCGLTTTFSKFYHAVGKVLHHRAKAHVQEYYMID